MQHFTKAIGSHESARDRIRMRWAQPQNRTHQKVLQRVKTLVRVGRPGDGLRTLVNSSKIDLINPSDPCVRAQLASLHPEATDADHLPLPSLATAPIIVTSYELMAGLKNLPAESAAGMSGWTNEIIKIVLNHEERLIQPVVTLFNKLLAGHAGLPQDMWAISRLIPIQKAQGGIAQ